MLFRRAAPEATGGLIRPLGQASDIAPTIATHKPGRPLRGGRGCTIRSLSSPTITGEMRDKPKNCTGSVRVAGALTLLNSYFARMRALCSRRIS
jgi:hypothetical protein